MSINSIVFKVLNFYLYHIQDLYEFTLKVFCEDRLKKENSMFLYKLCTEKKQIKF